MRTFTLSSDKFHGEVIVEYTNDGVLNKVDFTDSDVTIEQRIAIVKKTQFDIRNINKIIEGTNGTLTEILREVTFDDFWKRYDDKLNSSKKKTFVKWNKMPKSEQIKAYNHIYKYFNSIPSGTRKKYAETYLNAELWNN